MEQFTDSKPPAGVRRLRFDHAGSGRYYKCLNCGNSMTCS